MSETTLIPLVTEIVSRSNALRLKHASEYQGHVSYCCIFCQTDNEFEVLNGAAKAIGRLANNTSTGPVYVVPALQTEVGPLRVIKVRLPDKTRPERGDADFAIDDFSKFKADKLGKSGFQLIERPHFEMLELTDSSFDVRAYFSNPPVEEHPGIKEALAAG